jgi:DNA-binding NarL/FixJ family response regulator
VTFLNETNERFGILVVDDHPIMRDGLRAVIEQEADMEISGEAADGKEAIEQFRKLLPDVMLIDLQMPVMDGLQAITAIRSEFPDATIIVLTTFPGDARVIRAFTLGATSHLLKTARREEIIRAIRGALTGRHIVAIEKDQEIASHADRERLTDREIVVLSLVAQGRSNRHIAEALNITEDTVKARMKNIMAKLVAQDRTQ